MAAGLRKLLNFLGSWPMDPLHEEYLGKIEWLGPGFDQEAFDVTVVNLRLPRLRRRS